MADEGELAVDHSRKEIAEMLVFLRKPYIRPYLSSGIPEPHGVDVTGIHECSPVPVLVLAEMNGGVESVREAVCKHPGQFRVREQARYLHYLVFNGLRLEKTVLRSRPVGNIVLCGH